MSRAPVSLTGTGVVAVVGLLLLAYFGTRAASAVSQAGAAAARAVDEAVSQAGQYARQAVQVVDGAAVTVVGTAGQVVGLPTPAQTVDDPAAVRWLADTYGWFDASKWATAGALVRAMGLEAGTGVPPSPASAAGQAHGITTADVWRITEGRP